MHKPYRMFCTYASTQASGMYHAGNRFNLESVELSRLVTCYSLKRSQSMSLSRFVRHSPFPSVSLPEVSLPQFLQERIEHHPHNKVAYIDGLTGATRTFGQFLGAILHHQISPLEHVHVIQRCLYHKYGVRKGDTVAIYASNSIDYPVIHHAFLALGAVVTQGSPRSKEPEMRYHLENSGLLHHAILIQRGKVRCY
jgi:hypothetical protein